MAFFKQLFACKNKPYIPSLEKVEDLTVNLAGASLAVSLPAQNMMGLKGSWRDSVNIYDREIYYTQTCEIDGVSPGFSKTSVFNRDIGLYGKPWVSEVLADLNVSSHVCRADNLPANMSCFNPSDFERVIDRRMYFSEGPGNFNLVENSSLAPYDWKVRDIQGTSWIHFDSRTRHEAYPNDDPDSLDTRYSSFVMAPIDDEYFLVVEFRRNGFMPSALSNQHLDNLQDTIIKSFKLTLSTDAKKKQLAVEQSAPYKPLSTARKPYEWDYYDVRRGNTFIGEPEWVISAPGSPAPDYKISG